MPIDEQDPYAWVDEEPGVQDQAASQEDPYAWVDQEPEQPQQDPTAEVDVSPLESIIPDISNESLSPFNAAKKIGTGLKDLIKADTTTSYKLARAHDDQALLYAKYMQFRDPAYLAEAEKMEPDILTLSQQIPDGTGNRMIQGGAGFISMLKGMQEAGVRGFSEGMAATKEVFQAESFKGPTAESNKVPEDMTFPEAEMPTNMLGNDGVMLALVRKMAGAEAFLTGVPAVSAAKEAFWDYSKEVAAGRAFKDIRAIADVNTGERIPDEIAAQYAEKIGIASATIQNTFLMGLGKLVPGYSNAVKAATTEAATRFTSSEIFKGLVLKHIEGATLFGSMSGADRIANEIGEAFAKHTAEELKGLDLPEKEMSEIVSTVMKSVNSGMEQSIGVSMLGLGKEAIVRQIKNNAIAKEAQFNIQREDAKLAAEVVEHRKQIDTLESVLPERATRVDRDVIAEGLQKERFIDNFLEAKPEDLNTVLEEGLFAPERGVPEYSIKEYRDTQTAVKAARTTLRAARKELTRIEDTPESAPLREEAKARVEETKAALVNLKDKAEGMEKAKNENLQEAIVKGTLDQNVEALAVDGSGTGISLQELAVRKEALAGKREDVRELQREKQDIVSQRIILEEEKATLLEEKRGLVKPQEGEKIVLKKKLDEIIGKIKESKSEISRIDKEIKSSNEVVDLEDRELSELTRKESEKSQQNLERVRANLKAAKLEGERAFTDPLSLWISAQGAADIGKFRLELKEAWANAKAARAAGDSRGFARAKAVIAQKMDLIQAKQDLRIRQKQVINDIVDMIKTGAAKRGKLDADGQAFFAELKPFSKGYKESLDWKSYNDIMTKADQGNVPAGLALDVWQMREQAKAGDFSFLESLHSTIKGVLDGSMAARDAYLGQRMAQQKLDTAKIVKEVMGDFEEVRGGEGAKDRVKRTLSFFGWDVMYDARSLLAAITQDSGKPFEESMAYRKMEDIDQSKHRDVLIKTHTEHLLQNVIDAVGIKPKFDPVLGKEIISAEAQALLWLERERIAPRNPLIGLNGKPVLEAHRSVMKDGYETVIPGDPNKFMFNPAELRSVYALLKEPKSRAQLERQGYTPDIIEAVFNAIDNNPREKALVYGLQEVFKSIYPEANEVYRKLNGRDLGEKDFYMHVVRKRSGEPVSIIETLLGEGYRQVSAESFGALKEMTNSHLEIEIQPDIQVAREYIKQMSQYVAYAEWARDASAIFRSSDFTDAVKKKWGEDFGGRVTRDFNKMVDNVIRGYRAPSQTEVGWINRAMSVAVKTTLAAKAKLMLGQMSSNTLYLDKTSIPEYVAGLNEFAKNPKEAMAFIDERSSYFSSRTWRTDQSLLSVSQELHPGVNRTWNDAKFWMDHATNNIFMKNITWGDKISSYAGGYAMYRALRKQGVPERQAMRKAEIYTRDTQQSSEMSSQSNIQAGGTFDRLMTVYASQQMGMYRMQQKSIRDAFNAEGRYRVAKAKFEDGKISAQEFAAYETARKATWKASVKTGLIFSILEPMLFAYISSGFKADPDEMKAATLSTFYTFPIAGQAFEGVVRKSLGLSVYGEGTVLGDFIDNWRKASEDVISGESDTIFRDAATILQSFPQSGGLPLKTMVDILSGGEDIIVEGEIPTGVKKIMGYSPTISEE